MTTKEIFIMIFAPVLFLSNFVLNAILQNIKEFSFVYLNRPLFILLVVAIALYALAVSAVVRKMLAQSKGAVRQLVIFAMTFLATYYVSTYIHPADNGIFFLNMLGIGLAINIVLTLLISAIIKSRLAR